MQLMFRMTKFGMQYPRWVEDHGKKLAEEIILTEIKKRMADFNYSPKIIKATTIEEVTFNTDGFMDIAVDSDYKADTGFDVAEAREKGTKDHFVAPVIAKALSFILQGATGIIGSFRVFSKGHWVKGITKTNVIEKTIKELTPRLQARLNEETDAHFIDEVKP